MRSYSNFLIDIDIFGSGNGSPISGDRNSIVRKSRLFSLKSIGEFREVSSYALNNDGYPISPFDPCRISGGGSDVIVR